MIEFDLKGCRCYVRELLDEVQFGLHWGAHNPACPAYKESLDPVDRANDIDYRIAVEKPYQRLDR